MNDIFFLQAKSELESDTIKVNCFYELTSEQKSELCERKVHFTAPQMHSCRVSANLHVYNWGFDT